MSAPLPFRASCVRLVPFGGVELPSQAFAPHHLVLGTTQSGKTLCIRMMLNAWLRRGGKPGRCLIYDGKREYYPMFVGMGFPLEQIHILNPADKRCVGWDIAGDIRGRDDARNIVDLLIPEDPKGRDNPFFPQAIRSLVAEVMLTHHARSPGEWNFAGVLDVMRTPRRIRSFLGHTQRGREVCERYFTSAKETVGGIISTVDARFISVYDTIAATWAQASRSIRLTDWVKGNSTILLGYDANRAAVNRINQAIFQRVAQLTTSLPENADATIGKTWIVLDELRFTGKLPMLPDLISFGRTKGIRVILAPQDIDGLYDVYGEHAANEMLALCGNIAILRLVSPKTREWAAKLMGEYEAWETDSGGSATNGSSVTWGSSGGSMGTSVSSTSSWNRKIAKRESILSSEFFGLPVTDRMNGMHGFFATPRMGAWRGHLSPAFIDAHLPKNDPYALPFEPVTTVVSDPSGEVRRKPRYNKARAAEPPDLFTVPDEGTSAPPEPADDAAPKKKRKKPIGGLPSW